MREKEIELKHILERELSLYETMLSLAKRKTEILKESDIRELELLSAEESEKLEEIRLEEVKRESAVKSLAESLSLDYRLDLSKMSEYFSLDGKAEFKEIRETFKSVIDFLKDVNALNDTLIKDSLEYIDFSLNVISSASVDGSYGRNFDGAENTNTSKKSLFDFKA